MWAQAHLLTPSGRVAEYLSGGGVAHRGCLTSVLALVPPCWGHCPFYPQAHSGWPRQGRESSWKILRAEPQCHGVGVGVGVGEPGWDLWGHCTAAPPQGPENKAPHNSQQQPPPTHALLTSLGTWCLEHSSASVPWREGPLPTVSTVGSLWALGASAGSLSRS